VARGVIAEDGKLQKPRWTVELLTERENLRLRRSDKTSQRLISSAGKCRTLLNERLSGLHL
jgi:hypothetical protein